MKFDKKKKEFNGLQKKYSQSPIYYLGLFILFVVLYYVLSTNMN